MSIRNWLILVVLSVLWGGSFLFIELALRDFEPLTVAFFRVTVAAVLLCLFVLLRDHRFKVALPVWGSFFIMALFNNVIPFVCITWGQKYITGSMASILNATTPFFSIVIVAFILRTEQLTANRLIGLFLGFLGVVVLLGFDILARFDLSNIGQILVLCGSCGYAIAASYGRRFAGMSHMIVATGMLICASITLLPIAVIIERPFSQLCNASAIPLFGLLALAVISTVLAYYLYFHLLKETGPTNVLLVTFLIPVSATILGITILREPVTTKTYVGMAIILTSILVLDGRLFGRCSTSIKSSEKR